MSNNVIYSLLFEEEEDYRGSHMAPDKDDAPLWDVSSAYPDDIYTLPLDVAARYYGHSEPGDASAVALIRSYHNKPKMKVRVYRAVPPPELTREQQILKLEQQKKYILKTGKFPRDVTETKLNPSRYYEYISGLIEKLKTQQEPEKQIQPYKIKSGDWVTLYRPYAVGHGEGSLRGKYKVVSKVVRVNQLFTDGNSIYEFGYVEL